ncbi:MAG: TolC family protein [Myxococcales bacterium]|nr:TolC family protein [Myxococcales bacterium]
MKRPVRCGLVVGLALLGTSGIVFAEPHRITIQEVMEAAAFRTLPAKIVTENVAMAQASRRIAQAELLPRIAASAQVTRNPEELVLDGRTVVRLWDVNAQASVSIDLFRGTALMEWLASGLSLEAAEMDARWRRAELRVAAARGFLGVLAAKRNLEAVMLTLEQRQATLRDAEMRLDAGFGTSADVAKAKLSLVEAQGHRLEATTALEDAQAELEWVSGIDVSTTGDLDPVLPTFEPAAERADIAALRLSAMSIQRSIDGQWLDFIPILSMVGRAEFGEESLRAPDGVSWTVSFQATWSLYEPSRYGRLDLLASEARALDLEADSRVQTMEYGITKATRAVQTAIGKVTLAEESLALAEEVQNQVRERFRQGVTTALEVTDADVATFRARVGLNVVQLQVDLARIELAWATGALDG